MKIYNNPINNPTDDSLRHPKKIARHENTTHVRDIETDIDYGYAYADIQQNSSHLHVPDSSMMYGAGVSDLVPYMLREMQAKQPTIIDYHLKQTPYTLPYDVMLMLDQGDPNMDNSADMASENPSMAKFDMEAVNLMYQAAYTNGVTPWESGGMSTNYLKDPFGIFQLPGNGTLPKQYVTMPETFRVPGIPNFIGPGTNVGSGSLQTGQLNSGLVATPAPVAGGAAPIPAPPAGAAAPPPGPPTVPPGTPTGPTVPVPPATGTTPGGATTTPGTPGGPTGTTPPSTPTGPGTTVTPGAPAGPSTPTGPATPPPTKSSMSLLEGYISPTAPITPDSVALFREMIICISSSALKGGVYLQAHTWGIGNVANTSTITGQVIAQVTAVPQIFTMVLRNGSLDSGNKMPVSYCRLLWIYYSILTKTMAVSSSTPPERALPYSVTLAKNTLVFVSANIPNIASVIRQKALGHNISAEFELLVICVIMYNKYEASEMESIGSACEALPPDDAAMLSGLYTAGTPMSVTTEEDWRIFYSIFFNRFVKVMNLYVNLVTHMCKALQDLNVQKRDKWATVGGKITDMFNRSLAPTPTGSTTPSAGTPSSSAGTSPNYYGPAPPVYSSV